MNQYVRYFLRADLQRVLCAVRKHVYKRVGRLSAEYVAASEPIPFAERAEGLKPIRTGTIWNKTAYGAGWFHLKGEVPARAKNQHVALLISVGCEAAVVAEDGTPTQGLSGILAFVESIQPTFGKRYVEFLKTAAGGEPVDVWVEAGNNLFLSEAHPPKAKFKQADIVVVNDDVKALYYDMLTLIWQALVTNRETSEEKYKSIIKAVKFAAGEAKPFTKERVTAARKILQAEMEKGEENPYQYYATGHAHLDLAWLWPIRETQRKAGRTFTNALRNIERYEGFVFGASQPQQFSWMEEMYPALFEEISGAIASGRIEPQGGMWVECDTNVPSGESLIRQNLYGTRYWKEKFNKEVKMCWLPDVFGFSGNLPQILKKCGMDYFLTIKLSWNEHNKFPKRSFVWEGIDNSQVLVHMPPEETYNSDAMPISLLKGVKNYPEKDVTHTLGMLFGVGDGGGGPGEGHLEMLTREAAGMKGLPKVKMAPAAELFEELEKDRAKFETFKGELYLEKHQGTYTTQSNNKYFNNRMEKLLHNVEFLYAALGMDFPAARIEKIWKEVLLYQFHDIIPGSSIGRVYTESVARYEKMKDELLAVQGAAIAAHAQEAEGAVSAVNVTGYALKDIVKKGDAYYTADLAPYSAGPLTPYVSEGKVRANEDSIESERFLVRFDGNGNIVSLYDKRYKVECAGGSLNQLSVYKDKRLHYNAWDISIDYTKQTPAVFKLIGASVQVTDAQVIRENLYSYGKSNLTQKVILTAGRSYVEFNTVVDWNETHKMLRAEFRPAVFADQVTCDIQMGNLKRSTKNDTAVEKAQYEICAHKWVDVSKDGRGFSVLSDSKYGWRVKEGLISLNLLRSPMYPARDADKGAHNIRYAVYPHAGDAAESNVAKYAYQFNNAPVLAEGIFEMPSFASSSAKNVVVETVKPAENGEGIVLRAYEDSGTKTRVKITCAKQGDTYETDLLENVIAPAKLEYVDFEPFEIKTFLIK